MIIGKLYLVKQLCWLLFPKKEVALASEEAAKRTAKWLSEQFKCNVSVVEENTYVVLLEVDDEYIKVLDSNGNIGWTRCWEFSEYFKLVVK